MCWIGIFAVCGIGLLATGVVYARSSFEDPRAELVAQYNTEVDLWNDPLREEFENSKFSFRVLNPHLREVHLPAVKCQPGDGDCKPRNATTLEKLVTLNLTDIEKASIAWEPLAGVDPEDHLAKPQKVDDIHPYSGLVYEASEMFSEEPEGEWDGTEWTGAPYMLELRAETPAGIVTKFEIGPVPLLKQHMIGANQKMCRIHYGNNMHRGHCWDTFALSRICVQLNKTDNGWAPDSNGNIGCGGRDPAVYDKHCPSSSRLLTPSSPLCDFSHVDLSVRSASDPHTAALQLTDGTLFFGPTPSDNWQQGLVMALVGAVLLCPVAPVLYLKLAQRRGAYQADMHMHDVASLRSGSSRSRSASPHTRVDLNYDDDGVYADGGVARGKVVRPYHAHDML